MTCSGFADKKSNPPMCSLVTMQLVKVHLSLLCCVCYCIMVSSGCRLWLLPALAVAPSLLLLP